MKLKNILAAGILLAALSLPSFAQSALRCSLSSYSTPVGVAVTAKAEGGRTPQPGYGYYFLADGAELRTLSNDSVQASYATPGLRRVFVATAGYEEIAICGELNVTAQSSAGSLASFSCSLIQNSKAQVTGIRVTGSFVAYPADPYAGYGFVEVEFNPGGVGTQVGKSFELDLPYNFGASLPLTPPPYKASLKVYATGEVVARQCGHSQMTTPVRVATQVLSQEEVEVYYGRSLPVTAIDLQGLSPGSAMPVRGGTGQAAAGQAGLTIGLPPAGLTGGQVWLYPTQSGVTMLMAEDGQGGLSFVSALRGGAGRVVFQPPSTASTAWVGILLADNGLVAVARHSTVSGFVTGDKKDTMSVKFGFPVGAIYELNGIGRTVDFVQLDGTRLRWLAGGGQTNANTGESSWVGYFQQPMREGLLVVARLANGVAECDSRWYR